jgi:hypothetical protein
MMDPRLFEMGLGVPSDKKKNSMIT